MSRTVIVVELWENHRRSVYTASELALIFPRRKNKPRMCRSHAAKIIHKRYFAVTRAV